MNERDILNYFINAGYSKAAASAIVGTLMSESSLRHDAVNKNSGAYGYAQWLGSRKKELFKRYGEHPTAQNQLDYILWELQNTHRGANDVLKNSQDINKLVDAMFGNYEFSVGKNKAILAMNNSGQNGEASLADKLKHSINTYNKHYGNISPYRAVDPNSVQPTQYFDDTPRKVLTGRVVQSPDGQYSIVDKNIPSAIAYENADRAYRMTSSPTLNAPIVQANPETIAGPVLQDVNVYGRPKSPRLSVPSLMDTHRQYLNYQMLKNAGMIDEDDDDFLKYVAVNNLFAPIQKYKWGKDAPITLDSNKTYTIDNSAEDVWKDYLNDNLLSIQKSAWKDSRNYRNFQKQNALVEDMTGELEDAAFNNWVQSKKGSRLINRTIKNTRKSYYDLYGNDIQSMFDGAKWANDYYNSQTYKDLKANAGIQPPSFSAQGPLRIRFTQDGDNSFYRSLNNMEMSPEINFGLRGPSGIYKNDKVGTNPYWTGAHEYAHYIDSRDLSGAAHAFYPDSYNAIFDARHMPKYADDNPNKQYNYDQHDGTTTENYADFVANRAAMAKAGLYNSLDPNAKISMRNIQKYRKKYGNSDRLFQMYSDQDIYNMYNTIAYNPVQNLNMPYIT